MYTRACKVAVLAALVCALLLALPECEANTNRALRKAFRSPAFSGPTTTGGSSQSIQGPKRLTREECETKGRSLLPSISSDPDIMSCAGSVSDKCCGAVRRQLGKGGPLYGCNCHGGFVQEAVQQAPEFVRAVIYEALAGCSVSC
ncbi:hypothetical protein HOP50_03g25090 [Chloropicon primus]|uniref:Uncharacterized protein n=1 Tax=Chloropicon primus TaxID=1764295 RepID=A0A5B8MI67_9CHLO|nr:hypothetical protein A3770_03p25090 [Chloropicon primus]UPQ99202.1 hypothetical protein HOP50_03g25090 [Chloropicon primus]|eukprot:QDZ19991.1 hypothetical protein A3770_03p25090 [Chloropicon primus]